MFSDYSSLSPLMEDFSDILLDYDIACEGIGATVANAVKQGISILARWITQLCNYLRNKFNALKAQAAKKKAQVKGASTGVKEPDEEPKKEGKKVQISNWDLDHIGGVVSTFFGRAQALVSTIPMDDYKAAMTSDIGHYIDAKLIAIKDLFDFLKDNNLAKDFADIAKDAYEGRKKETITVDSATPEGDKIITKYLTSESILNDINSKVSKFQNQTNDMLRKIATELDSVEKSWNKIDSNFEMKRDIINAMKAFMNATCKNIQVASKEFNKLMDDFNNDFIKIVMIA